MTIPRLLLTPGEPTGIGPDVTIKIAQQHWPAELIAIANPELLQARAQMLGLPLKLIEYDSHAPASEHVPQTLKIIPVPLPAEVVPGQLNPLNSPYVLRTLEIAGQLCMQKAADAVVTGPVHKGIMLDAGIAFSGHTEYFAQLSGVPLTVMLFVLDQMKVALATTHLPLARVPTALTREHLRKVLLILHQDLQTKFQLEHPHIAVCGLNPHAGENGHLGREEIEIFIPLIQELNAQGYKISGPFSADTIYLPQQEADAILAMYHDQALPLVKYLGFDHAVNVTLGLPFIRTSVDHGTALDLAGTGAANPGSMDAAVKLALRLAVQHGHR